MLNAHQMPFKFIAADNITMLPAGEKHVWQHKATN